MMAAKQVMPRLTPEQGRQMLLRIQFHLGREWSAATFEQNHAAESALFDAETYRLAYVTAEGLRTGKTIDVSHSTFEGAPIEQLIPGKPKPRTIEPPPVDEAQGGIAAPVVTPPKKPSGQGATEMEVSIPVVDPNIRKGRKS